MLLGYIWTIKVTDSRKLLAFQTQENTESLLVRQLIVCFYLFLIFFSFSILVCVYFLLFI